MNLLAVCSSSEPVYLVTEYLENGRLSLYLREGEGKELNDAAHLVRSTGKKLKALDLPNIVNLLCSSSEPVYLVTEYLENGRLPLYLGGEERIETDTACLVRSTSIELSVSLAVFTIVSHLRL